MIRDLKYNSVSSSIGNTTRRQHQLAIPGTMERNGREKSANSKAFSLPYSHLSSLEIAFLEKRARDLEAGMDRELAFVENESGGWGALPWHRRQRLEVYERESEILLEMLTVLKHNRQRLDDVLSGWLGQIHQRTAQGRAVNGSTAAYWETNLDRQIVVRLLGDWWRWLKAKIKP